MIYLIKKLFEKTLIVVIVLFFTMDALLLRHKLPKIRRNHEIYNNIVVMLMLRFSLILSR